MNKLALAAGLAVLGLILIQLVLLSSSLSLLLERFGAGETGQAISLAAGLFVVLIILLYIQHKARS